MFLYVVRRSSLDFLVIVIQFTTENIQYFLRLEISYRRQMQTYISLSLSLYIYIYIYHVALSAWISQILSHHHSLSSIASGRSSGLHPLSAQSCCMKVRAGRPAFARPTVGVHRSMLLMSSSLLLQQCPSCLVRLTLKVFVMGCKLLYKAFCPYTFKNSMDSQNLWCRGPIPPEAILVLPMYVLNFGFSAIVK